MLGYRYIHTGALCDHIDVIRLRRALLLDPCLLYLDTHVARSRNSLGLPLREDAVDLGRLLRGTPRVVGAIGAL
eukprot:477576-Prymnesium_polylepis.1